MLNFDELCSYNTVMKSGPMKTWIQIKTKLVYGQNFLALKFISFNLLTSSNTGRFHRLGSDYGGWHVPSEYLSSRSEKLLISVGLGHDVSFDLAMLENNFKVIGLDPLTSSIEHASRELASYSNRVEIINVGFWKECGLKTFYSPSVQAHDSWSITNVHETHEDQSVKFEVVDLTFLAENSSFFKNSEIRILKLDIEGAELALFPMIANFEPKFQQISVEMDFVSLIKFRQFGRRIRAVQNARQIIHLMARGGYGLSHIEHFNFTWVLNHPKAP